MAIIQNSKGIKNTATGETITRDPAKVTKNSLASTISDSLVEAPKVTAPTVAPAPQVNSMVIPQGATLNNIARENNTTIQELQKLNPQILNPDLIFAGSKLNLPTAPKTTATSTTPPAVPPVTEQPDPKKMAEEANQRSEKIYQTIENQEVTERESSKLIRDAIAKIATQPTPEKPKSMVDLYTETKQSLGIDPLETRLAEIDSEIERLSTGALVDQERAENRPVGQRQIDLRKNTIADEANLRIALLQTERSAVARLADNKLSSLKMIMDFTKDDYENASKYYNDEYNRNIDLINLYATQEDREIKEEDRQTELKNQVKKDAQAQLTTMSNLLKDSRKTFADLTPDQKRSIEQWELEAGFPVGTYEAFGVAKPEAKIIHTASGVDEEGNEIVTFIYEDPANPGRPGVTEIIKTGGFEDKTSSTTTNQITDNERALFSQFKSEPIVKVYNETLNKKLSVDAIVQNGVGGPADLALVFEFMKGLDPTSVVRESEYASAAKSGNIFAGAFAKFNGYFKEKGGILPESVKEEFSNLINQKLDVSRRLYDNLANEYKGIAERQGLDPRNVITGYSNAQDKVDNLTPEDKDIIEKMKADGIEDWEIEAYIGKPISFNSVGNTSGSNRPQRNNNPLNIKASEATLSYGGVAGTDPKPATDGGKFLVFETPEDGFEAAKRLIQTSGYINLTVDGAMKRWSNSGYGGEIMPNIKNKKISELTQSELDALIRKMAEREGFFA